MTENQLYSISENIKRIRENVSEAAAHSSRSLEDISIMAVTKTIDVERINAVVAEGITLLGENRAQELLEKYDSYDKSAKIHFIGGLQSNKIRQIIDKVEFIQSLDRLSLAQEINRQCVKHGKTMDVLIEINIGQEESKSGIDKSRILEFVHQLSEFESINIKGLMTIPPISADLRQSEVYFAAMREIFVDIKQEKIDNVSMDILSMGMSGDYAAAIRQGSNMVRLGTAIFGKRI